MIVLNNHEVINDRKQICYTLSGDRMCWCSVNDKYTCLPNGLIKLRDFMSHIAFYICVVL